MDNDKNKKKPLKLSSSGRLQIRKNLGPSGENKTTGNNKKTIQIVFRNKNNQQKSSSTAKSNFRGSSTFRTNTQVTPNLTNSNKSRNYDNKNKKSFCIIFPIILTSTKSWFLLVCLFKTWMVVPFILASSKVVLVFTSSSLSLPPIALI